MKAVRPTDPPRDPSNPPTPYVGRFAPSPSGPLHAGSLVAALASYLDARAHRGRWLVRLEDIDAPRTVPGADRIILRQLQALGMHWDEPPVWQTQRHAFYRQAFDQLLAARRTYPCHCRRGQLPPGPYPGTCRPQPGKPPPPADAPAADARRPAWRFIAAPGVEHFRDRWLGPQSQDVAGEVGDFIIRRADGLWAYQLVVVVDDGLQGITDVVRGADLLDSSARQRQLARALGLPCPRLLHVPLRLDSQGRKLSKQNHAPALDTRQPLAALQQAWADLGFAPLTAHNTPAFWADATGQWARRFA
ncbi:tRNA glutamyl-Q(34) synthetase GluQRS [Castellaniella hirudinis]|uniref:tRNA glutamyl-Q(34) synthetase GluQRS n=1 Tax=Castellaniella hirudinis TaxID=1144617 RepID=UPI0039C002B2